MRPQTKTTYKRQQTDKVLKNNYLTTNRYIGNKRHFVY